MASCGGGLLEWLGGKTCLAFAATAIRRLLREHQLNPNH